MGQRFSLRVEAYDNEKQEVMARFEYPNLDRADLLEVEEVLTSVFGLEMLEKGIQIAEDKGDASPEKIAKLKSRTAQKKRGLAMMSGQSQ